MKWIVVLAALLGLWWASGAQISGWIGGGRDSMRSLTSPVSGLSKTLDRTRTRVEETNRTIGALGMEAEALAPPSGGGAYGAGARDSLDRMGATSR